MTPSIDHRIDSLIQAMSDIVLPAIDHEKGLAREQAQLIMAHLHLIKQQIPLAQAFDQLELDAAVRLGRQLLQLEANNPDLAPIHKVLEGTLTRHAQDSGMHQQTRRIEGAIEDLIRALRHYGTRSSIDQMTATVLAHAKEHSRRNRIWFASNGFDADGSTLPAPDRLFATTP